MKSALIGCTGFVGSTLRRQTCFSHFYHSTDIDKIEHQSFDLIVCAAAPAKKWYANLHPEEDLQNIRKLIGHLEKVSTQQFVLVSTVDVFKNPFSVDENSQIVTDTLHPYGLHRYYLEEFVKTKFRNRLIVRLPGLVGVGLRKNILYDFKHNNQLQAVNAYDSFQFYPMINLWKDITLALQNNLSLLHLTAYPLQVREIAQKVFNLDFKNKLDREPLRYDMQSIYASLWGKIHYQYDMDSSLKAIQAYSQNNEGD